MSKISKPDFQTATATSSSSTWRQMNDALQNIIYLRRCAQVALRRQLRRGQARTARRLAQHLHFLTQLIVSLRAEMATSQLAAH